MPDGPAPQDRCPTADGSRGSRPATDAAIVVAEEDPATPDIAALLAVHLESMRAHSPPESVHALDIDVLRVPAVRFWSARDAADGTLLGCGACKRLAPDHAELKSMRTASSALRRGVARTLLRHIVEAARASGVVHLSLETGSGEAFAPALRFYEREGFVRCAPFADYTDDPFSVFMTRCLQERPARDAARSSTASSAPR